jgi:glycine/D-amino acid oxidase-like deaminating enzyme
MTMANSTADVVIAGGGIVGLSCAAFLAKEGLRVVLVEQGGLGSGTSRAGQGGVGIGLHRKDWDLRWHRAAMAAYAEIAEDGFSPDYRVDGALVVCDDEATGSDCRAAANRLSSEGVEAVWLGGIELRREEPALSQRLAGGVLVRPAAQVSPFKVMAGLAERARAAGAVLLLDTQLTGIGSKGGNIRDVETSRGRIDTGRVVMATGVSSRSVCQLLHLSVPIWPLKGHLMATEPAPGMLRHYVSEAGYERTTEATLNATLTSEGLEDMLPQVATILQNLPAGPLLVGSSREFSGFDRAIHPDRVAEIASRAARLVPQLADVRAIRIFTGRRPWTPDGRLLVGPTRALEGLCFAAGHGGDGTTGALLTGRLVADLLLGRKPPLDPAPVAPDHFRLQ